MAKKYDIFDAASWLLDETYSIYEDAKEEATETASDETDETEDDSEYTADEDGEVDNSDLADPVDDTEEDDGELTDLDATEETKEDEVDPEDQDIYSRLDVIEDKIDALSDKTPKADDDETFDLDLSNPVCPCCGARLNIIDSVPDTEDFDTKEGDEDADIDGISDLLDGEGPTEEPETEGEDITAMDDALDNVEDLGYNDDDGYVSLDNITDDDDDED
jgi:AAA ATPase containing von Willebrand factor type A (vWA) domain